jgi:hypothetical protein
MTRRTGIGAVAERTQTAGAGHEGSPARRRARWAAAALLSLALIALLLPSSGANLAADALQTAFGAGLAPTSTHAARAGAKQRRAGARSSASYAGPIIGTNDAAGWGPVAARTILQGNITWNRVELGSPYNTLASSHSDGFKALAIVNNTNDETPLSTINPSVWGAGVVSELKGNPGVSIAEAGNEAYLKGDVAEPVQYGRMYLAAVGDMQAAGIHMPLLFNMTGDIPLNTWADPNGWSEDAKGGGWLRDAVNGVPGLAGAILANGISVHPYGAVGENSHDDWGTASVAADEAVTKSVLGATPPVYVTEIGFDLGGCGDSTGACSRREQASKLQAAYAELLADPHVAGIWWYQSHDDSTGRWGFMNRNGSTRPSFKALSAIATTLGQ